MLGVIREELEEVSFEGGCVEVELGLSIEFLDGEEILLGMLLGGLLGVLLEGFLGVLLGGLLGVLLGRLLSRLLDGLLGVVLLEGLWERVWEMLLLLLGEIFGVWWWEVSLERLLEEGDNLLFSEEEEEEERGVIGG